MQWFHLTQVDHRELLNKQTSEQTQAVDKPADAYAKFWRTLRLPIITRLAVCVVQHGFGLLLEDLFKVILISSNVKSLKTLFNYSFHHLDGFPGKYLIGSTPS